MAQTKTNKSPNPKSAWRTGEKRITLWIIAAFIALPVLLGNLPRITGLVGYGYIVSNGDRVGQVTQLSKSGLIWKSWEGTLALTQNGSVAENWLFSLDNNDPDLDQKVKMLETAVNSGATLKLTYEKHIGIQEWRAKTSYTVTGVQVLATPVFGR